MKLKSRVFISYSYSDQDTAHKIKERLIKGGIEVVSDYEDLQTGKDIFEQILVMLGSSESVIILLSPNLFKSGKFEFEFPSEFFKEARRKKVNIIPVLIKNFKIPVEFIEYEVINVCFDFNRGVDKLIKYLKYTSEITFEKFSGIQFEELIYDLLKAYRFSKIQKQTNFGDDGIDFIAEYLATDPFGVRKKETWVIESKLYKYERFSYSTVHKLVESYKYINMDNVKILFITNSILTSVVAKQLEEVRSVKNIPIEVIDGVTLRNLIVKKESILNKYFKNESD